MMRTFYAVVGGFVALVLVLLLGERQQTARMLMAQHKAQRCYPPHCAVCQGKETPDGRKVKGIDYFQWGDY